MLYRALRSDDEVLAAAATPLLTPFVAPYSLAALLTPVACKHRREAFFAYVGFWAYLIVESRRIALM